MRVAATWGVALLAGLLAWGAADASAATITVTNNADSGSGSLRAALAGAASGDTIVVPAESVTLTSGPLVVGHSVTIQGAGDTHTAVSGNFTSRVFEVLGPGVTATLAGMQILNGEAPVVEGHAAGGGIFVNEATLTLSNDLVVSNEAVSNGTGSNNGGTADGGGVFAGAGSSLTVISSLISDNWARAEGLGTGIGGISEGGAVADRGQLAISESAIVGNTSRASGGGGGGLAEAGGVLFDEINKTVGATIERTSITGNDAIANALAPGVKGGDAAASGVDLVYGSSQRLADDTISGNSVISDGDGTGGGGDALDGAVDVVLAPSTLVNVTIAGNTSKANSEAGTGGDAFVGGLRAGEGGEGEPATITNSTIDGNTAEAAGATLGKAEGGNLSAGESTIENTIIAAGTADPGQENCTPGTAGKATSLGGNIDSLDQCGFHGAGDRVNTNPLLEALRTNGGPVETMALQPGSPAIDGGHNSGCPGTDARGVLRPAGPACDSGAFEVAEPSAATEAASAVGSSSATLNGSARNPDLAGGEVSFQYGTTTAYGTATAAQAIGPTVAAGAFSAAVSGLAPGKTYHFRLEVQNAIGTAFGADQSFTTPSPKSGPLTPVPLATLDGGPHGGPSGTTFSLAASCTSAVACPLSIIATTKETLRHGKVLALSSRTRTVTVASANPTVPGATAHRQLAVKLNALGRALERRFGRLPITLSVYVIQGSKRVLLERVHLVLRPRRRHRH